MKPAPFAYSAPDTVEETLAVLADIGGDGKVLAGGQSLLPLLNMRLAAPAHLVDINRLGSELGSVTTDPAGVRVGALARHVDVERDEAAHRVLPLLRQSLQLVAHPVIRNRGTTVGSIVHADPAGELPAVLALTGGSVELATSSGTRTVSAHDFFLGPLESAIKPGELATAAFFPAFPPGTGTAFAEVARRHGDYAVAGVAAAVTVDDDLLVVSARAALVSVAPTPVVLDLTGEVAGRAPATADWGTAGRAAAAAVEPEPDIHASAAYRTHLVAVLSQRALHAAADTAARQGSAA